MTAANNRSKHFVFTGWHMLAVMVAFFGVIVSVNMLMAYYANSSWSGILAKNTYVASQEFNAKAEQARQWAVKGFDGTLTIDQGQIVYHLKGPTSTIGALSEVKAIFHRPVGDRQDFSLVLTPIGDGRFSATRKLAPGQWIVDLAAMADDRVVYHQAERILIAEK